MMALWMVATALFADIGPDDLPAYKAALESRRKEAQIVSFRDLWDHPDEFRGRCVEVKGAIVRTFHAGPSGELPARVEYWITTASGDLICAVYPNAGAKLLPTSELAFRGISLGKITYSSGDVPRMAPLIVGPGPPEATVAAKAPVSTPHSVEWILALIVAVGVMSALLRIHLRKPLRRVREAGPSLEFLDSPSPSPVIENYRDGP